MIQSDYTKIPDLAVKTQHLSQKEIFELSKYVPLVEYYCRQMYYFDDRASKEQYLIELVWKLCQTNLELQARFASLMETMPFPGRQLLETGEFVDGRSDLPWSKPIVSEEEPEISFISEARQRRMEEVVDRTLRKSTTSLEKKPILSFPSMLGRKIFSVPLDEASGIESVLLISPPHHIQENVDFQAWMEEDFDLSQESWEYVLGPGQQIVYYPEGNTTNPDFGWISGWNDDGSVVHCYFWAEGAIGSRLRSPGNSEACPIETLRHHKSVRQEIVYTTISDLAKRGQLHDDEEI